MSGVELAAALVLFGVLTGVTSGLLGVGGGTLMVPFLTIAVGLSQHAAEATSLLVILPTSIVGSVVLHRRGIGELGLALRFGLIGALGGAGGAALALAMPASVLKVAFALFLAIVGLRLVRRGLTAAPR